jgi:hypothetical protein
MGTDQGRRGLDAASHESVSPYENEATGSEGDGKLHERLEPPPSVLSSKFSPPFFPRLVLAAAAGQSSSGTGPEVVQRGGSMVPHWAARRSRRMEDGSRSAGMGWWEADRLSGCNAGCPGAR